ncbi:MAG: PAS domain S-box protein [Nitrospirota bacterium]
METPYRVLIVEDVPTDAELNEIEVKQVLSPCIFHRVETEEDFLRALDEFKPDIIISDYKMPSFDGMSALKLILDKTPLTPFIIVTGSMNEDIAVDCMKAGASNYVIKQHLKRLGPAVTSAMEQKHQRQERLMAEEALKESERKYRTLVENIPQKIFTKDRRSVYVSCNNLFARDLGITPEELSGKTDYDFFPKELADKYRSDDMRIIESGETEGIEEQSILGDEKVWVYIIKTPIRDKEGNIVGILGIFSDITERKNLEAQLLQAQKMEAVGQLAGGIAHDFNNILTAMIGYGHLLKMKLKEDDPLRTYAEQILSLSDKAANLTQSLLAFSRKRIMNSEPVSLNEVIRRIDHLLSRIIGEDIALQTRLSEEYLIVMADPGHIEQALMNLATNARDAMPEGGFLTIGTEKIAIDEEFIKEHGFGKEGEYALIAVTDTGAGMDRETREKIFEPFFTTKEVGKGTGLGLAMGYGII